MCENNSKVIEFFTITRDFVIMYNIVCVEWLMLFHKNTDITPPSSLFHLYIKPLKVIALLVQIYLLFTWEIGGNVFVYENMSQLW